MVSAWQKCQYHTDAHWAHSLNTLWWTQLECVLHSDQLTRGHIRMGTAPESTAQPLTALTTNYSLHPACMHTAQCSRSHDHTVGWAESGVASGVICRGCSLLHSPTAEWRPQGGRRPPHSLCSPRTTPICVHVCCVWTTGASLAVTTHRDGSLGLIQIHRIPCQTVTPGSFTPCGALWVGHLLGGAT